MYVEGTEHERQLPEEMMSGGYTADQAAMANARTALQQALTEVESSLSGLKSREVGEIGFGLVHKEYYQPYVNGMDTAEKAVSSYIDHVKSLAGGIGNAGNMYAENDAQTSARVENEGGNV